MRYAWLHSCLISSPTIWPFFGRSSRDAIVWDAPAAAAANKYFLLILDLDALEMCNSFVRTRDHNLCPPYFALRRRTRYTHAPHVRCDISHRTVYRVPSESYASLNSFPMFYHSSHTPSFFFLHACYLCNMKMPSNIFLLSAWF